MKKITGIILLLLLSYAVFAQVTISGATEASAGAINKSYTTLKAAFDAINGNASGLATDVLTIEISGNTTETAAPTTLIGPKAVSSVTVTPGATTYKFPQITLTGGTYSATGTFVVTIYNGKVQTITNTGGTWTVAPTISIEGAGGPSGLNVTTQATAFCTTGGSNLTFYITDGGAGYGPKTTVTANSGGSGAAVGFALISAATTPASGVISPAAVAVSGSYLDIAGSGYTSGATAPATNTTGGTFASGTEATASYAIGITKANYASVKIYPTASNLTISATSTVNQPFIVLNGTKNVTIDGRVHTDGVPSGEADLTIQYSTSAASTNNASTIYLNAGANHNTIRYCKLKSVTQNGNTRGTLAIGTNTVVPSAVSSSVGGSYNTIAYNSFSALNSGSYLGNGGMLTFANCNDDYPNTYNTIDNNTFDNYFINGPTGNISAAIYLFGNPNPNKPNHSNYTITNNSFFNSIDGSTTANNLRMFIKVGNDAVYAYGGYGHTISGNYIGGKAPLCEGGKLTKTGAFADNMTCIYLYSSYGTATTIQNNVFKNISLTNGGAAATSTKFIDVNGVGPATISGNTIGDNAAGTAATASISIDNSPITTVTSSLYCIQNNATGDVTCENNSIGSILLKSGSKTNFAGIWKTATEGNFTIRNNVVGHATTATSILNNSASSYWTYGISSAGTGTITINGNTIANITSSTTTGYVFGINHDSGASTFNANANLIHSLNAYPNSTSAKIVGIFCARGTNSVTNNIIKLGGNNPATIYGLNEENTATSSSFIHNTVYISGAPTSGALNSACVVSNGTSNTRSILNNIFVNTRTNNGATGTHYALLMPTATGTVTVNANNYQATGASGAVLGSYNGTDITSGSVIVTGQDANSLNVNPVFASAGGNLAENYMTSASMPGITSDVTTDYAGTNRTAATMGAYFIPTIVPVASGVAYSNELTLSGASQIEVAAGAELNLNGVIPTISKIILAPTAKLTMGSNSINAPNGVVLQSDATGTATLTGESAVSNATVQQYLTAGRNWYISPSVSSPSYSTLNLGTSVVEWNESTKVWDTKTSGTLEAGKGYIQVATSSPSVTGSTGTVNFTGTTNNGDITTAFTLTRTGTSTTAGFNLVGNPYPSYLRWSGDNSVIADTNNSQLGTSFWYRTKNDLNQYIFFTHNGTSGYTIPANQTPTTLVNGIIPPMQAFWVRVNSNTTMKFTNAMRLHADNSANKFKAPKADERKRLRLELVNGSASDETLIYFDEQAENNFDNFDSPKMMNNSSTIPDLYTKAESENLVINGLNAVSDYLELLVGFSLKSSSSLKFKVGEMQNFEPGTKIYLIDKTESNQTELLPETEYNFSTNSSTINNESRFSILFRTPGTYTATTNPEKKSISVFVNAQNKVVIVADAGMDYAIFNVAGQQIAAGITTANSQTSVSELSSGVYIVKVNNQSIRVIVK